MIIKFILILMIIASPLFRGSVCPLAFGSLQILTAVAMLLWFLHMAKEGILRFKPTALGIPLLLFLLLAAASIFRAPYMHDSLIEFSKLVNLIAIFYLTVNHINDRRDIKKVVNVIVIVGAVLSIFGIIQYLGGITNSWWDIKNFLSSVYVNHNHFAGFLELSIPLCIGLALGERNGMKRPFYIYLFFVMLLAFMLSMSRGAWFSLAFSMSIMFILLYKKGFIRKRFFTLFFIFILIGFLFMKNGALDLFLGRIASYKEFDFEGRLEIWNGTLGIIKDNLFFGTGIGTFIHCFPRYRPAGLNLFVNYAHNDYLQLASELGIVSLFLAFYMLFLIARKAIKTYLVSESNFKKGVFIGMFTGILSIAIHSIVDFNLRIPANAILFAVLSGMIFSLRSRDVEPDKYFEIMLNRRALYVLRPLFIVIMFIWILGISRLVVAEAILISVRKAGCDEKLSGLNRAINILPGASDYYKKLAQIHTGRASINYYKEKDLLMALEYYRRASEINPADAWAWLGIGDSFLYLGDIDSARGFYKKALDLDPNNSYYLKKMGDLLVSLGNIDEAVNAFKRASLLEKKSMAWLDLNHGKYEPEIYIEKGDLYYRKGDLEGALKMYKLAEGLGSEEMSIKMVNILERMGQVDIAGKYPQPLNDSENVLLLNSRARHFISIGDYKKAEALIEKALSINQNDCMTLQNKIDLLQRQRKPFEEIRPYMQRLLELNDKNGEGFISGRNMALIFNLEKDGLMSSSGIKKISFILPLGLVGVKIVAAGTFAKNEWPHMLVRMNSTSILSAYVSSTSYAEYSASAFSQEGANLIEIEFSNDYFDSLSGEDRNLKINKIILEYKCPDYEN